MNRTVVAWLAMFGIMSVGFLIGVYISRACDLIWSYRNARKVKRLLKKIEKRRRTNAARTADERQKGKL